MSSKKTKRPAGRPRKIKKMLEDEFRRLVDKPEDESRKIELIFSDQKIFKQYSKTLNTLFSKDKIIFHFEKTRVLIEIIFTSRTTSSSMDQNKECIIEIQGDKIYSYYCEEPISIELKNNSIINKLNEYINEGVRFIHIFTEHGVDKVLNFDIVNQLMAETTTISTDVVTVFNSCNMISSTLDDVKLSIIDFNSSDLKKYFSRSKSNPAAKFTIKAHTVILEHKRDEGSTNVIKSKFNITDKIIVHDPTTITQISLPVYDLQKFNTNLKSTITIHMSINYTLLINSQEGITIKCKLPNPNDYKSVE